MIENGEVKLHFLDYWRVIKMRAGLITLVFLLIMVTAGVTIYFLPRRYLAKVTMEVRPDTKIGPTLTGGAATFDPQFLATQFQILRKSEILYPVIDKLELVKEFSGGGPPLSKLAIFNILQSSLDLDEVRATTLIEVGVWHTNRTMAANIANMISVEYRNRRLLDLQQQQDRGLAQFRDEVRNQEKVVEAAATVAAEIRSRDSILDPDPDNSSSVLPQSDDPYKRAEQQTNDQRVKVASIQSVLDEMANLKPEALKEALRQLGIEDVSVMNNINELQRARGEEASLLGAGLGENHPAIKGLRSRMVVNQNILTESLDAIRRSQATKLNLERSTLAGMEERLDVLKKEALAGRDKSKDYVEAKTKYIQAKAILQDAQKRLTGAEFDYKIDTVPVKIWEKAEEPLGAAFPNVNKYLFIAAVFGVIAGVLLAFFIEYLDTSVKTVDDVEKFLQTTVLAVIPKGIPMLLKIRGDHADAEAYRILRANLEFNKPSPDAKTLTLISAGPGEGKSTTLNNLAFTCAKGGYNVLVVDADVRRPTQHGFFDCENTFGLTDYLLGKATVDAITRTTKIDNLSFIPSGILPSDAVGILNSQPMSQLIDRVKSEYDLILFDSPPILGVSDGSVITSEMDMTIMVVQHRRFPRAMLQRVKQAVQQVGGAFIGVVLNNVDTRNDDGYSYYNAYQDYYSTPKRGETRRTPTTATPSSKPRRSVTVSTPPQNGDNGEY